MTEDLLHRLVDLYAGDELPEELVNELEAAADSDPELSEDMASLRRTVQALHEAPAPEMSEESYERVLLLMRLRGAEIEPVAETPSHWQYRLPLQVQ